MGQLVEFLTNRDTEGAAKLLSANVVTLSDCGGEFFAARVPVVGRDKVAVFLSRLVQGGIGLDEQTRVVELNGLFALITERANAPEGIAPKRASLFELDDDGLIRRMYFVLASRKLTALPGLAN